MGPQPQFIGAVKRAPQSPLEEALVAAGYNLTEQAHCAAREMSAFLETNDAWPSLTLQEYIDGWCGNVGSGTQRWFWKQHRPTADPKRVAAWVEDLKARIAPENGRDLGVVHNESTSRTFIYTAVRKADIEPIAMVEDSDTFVLRGTFLGEHRGHYEDVWARVNRGPYGSEHCTVDETVALPSFVLRCPSPGHTTRFVIKADVKASDEVGHQLWAGMRFRVDPGLNYRTRPLPDLPELSDDPTVATQQFVTALNAVRAKAGYPPLMFAQEQSKLVQRARPHLRVAFELDQYDLADDIISGLRAGWHVDGRILNAHWQIETVIRTDPRGLLEYLAISPASRELIFYPHAGALALDLNWLNEERTAAEFFAMTYVFVPDEHYNRTVGRAYDRLDEQRAQAGRGPARRMHVFNTEMKELCESVASGRVTVEKAYHELRTLPYGRVSKSYWSAYRTPSTLEKTNFFKDMVNMDSLDVAMCASPYKDDDSPRYRYVILMFWLEP